MTDSASIRPSPPVDGAAAPGGRRSFALPSRETMVVALLAVAAIPAFFATREAAVANRAREAESSRQWAVRGRQAMADGKVDAGVAALRRAVAHDRDNPAASLALAKALGVADRDAEARWILQRLREAAPERSEINLELARLSAKAGDVPAAVLYYRHALYGRWSGSDGQIERNATRRELARLLVERGSRGEALAELVGLEADPASDAGTFLEIGRLYARLGEDPGALRAAARAFELDPASGAAAREAAQVALRLGDYPATRRWADRALALEPEAPDLRALTELVDRIRRDDPLAPRLGTKERRARARRVFEIARERLAACRLAATGRPGGVPPGLAALDDEANALEPLLRAAPALLDPDRVQEVADLAFRIAESTRDTCGEPTGADLALLLIGRRHQGNWP